MCRLQIVLSVACSWIVLSDAEFDYNCIVNPLKPASLPYNYMDCSNDDHNNKGEFTCCDSQGTKVCCSLERRWGGVRYIAIGVGCTTILLGTMLFIILWCNVVEKPCVTPIPHCCCGKRRKKRMNKTKILELEEVVSVATEKIQAFQVDVA